MCPTHFALEARVGPDLFHVPHLMVLVGFESVPGPGLGRTYLTTVKAG